jgi:hypothetical protein
MKRRVLGPAVAALCLLLSVDGAGAQLPEGQYVASETYYRLDVEAGTLTARVEAEVQPSGADLAEVFFWAMPGAQDVTVTRDGSALTTVVDAFYDDVPALVWATLDQPLRGKLTADFVMTYSVPAGKTDLTDFQPGAIETMLVSQGAGSFILVDLPAAAENVIDPGCVLAANQPREVRDSGYERWVCGEVLAAAFGGENEKVRERCASLHDSCRQRNLADPFSAFVQSTTDTSLLSNLDADVPLAGTTVPLRLRYFRSNRAWAETQFSIAQQSLPKLEALFGFPYPHDEVLLRESTYILTGGALGIAFTSTGEMLLTAGTDVDSFVTIHELAHQWAGLELAEPWIWEGLAEYAARVIGPEVGASSFVREWKSLGYSDPLGTMYNGSLVYDPDYWYGRSGDFWFAYETAVGGRANMTTILSRLDDDPAATLDGRWFMDTGEEVSYANLDALFLEWVWHPDYATPELAARRAAHDLVDAFKIEAAGAALTGVPTDITANLREWTFGPVAGQLDDAREVLASYQELLAASSAAGLPPPPIIAEVWSTTTISAIARLVDEHLETVRLLEEAAADLAGLDPDHPSHAQLVDARKAYREGDLDRAADLAAKSLSTVYNAGASRIMIDIALEEQESFRGDFFTRIGLLWSDPDGDLEAARLAFEEGDHATALERSRAAYDAWNGARARGFQRLAMLAAAMGALSFGTWWLLARMDRGDEALRKRSIHDGHRLERKDPDGSRTRSRWRDWENTP